MIYRCPSNYIHNAVASVDCLYIRPKANYMSGMGHITTLRAGPVSKDTLSEGTAGPRTWCPEDAGS